MNAPAHLYVHVPFCRSKCVYCAFHSTTQTPPEDYAALIAAEVRLHAPEGLALQTLFIGGGTPTALGTERLIRLCAALKASLRDGACPPSEWTIEANPGSLSPEMAAQLWKAGVTRVSIGAQSFDPATLAVLGRMHDAEGVRAAVAAVRAAGISAVGIDLIAGIPGLSEAVWRRTLDAAMALDPDHLSVYGLTVEPGTPLAESVARGNLRLPGDDEQMDGLAIAEELLAARGYRRYEISNYAREGCECRHNLAIWRGEDYLGVGPAASSRRGMRRWTNLPDLAAWTDALDRGALPPSTEDWLSAEEDSSERCLTGLRLAEGVAPDVTTAQGRKWESALRVLVVHGVVRKNGGRWSLTARGREVADAVLAELQ